jgi:hypothetical protein
MKAIAKKRALLGLALGLLTGCSTDSANSLSRNYRNINNEAIDALMLVTNESRAETANVKIIKTYKDRLIEIDKRLDTYVQNQEEKLILFETLTSESVVILFAECTINQKRLDLEQQRLKNLLATLVQREKDRRKEANDPEEVKIGKLWPNLDALTAPSAGGLRENLRRGTGLAELMLKFPQAQFKGARPADFDVQMKGFNERVKMLGMK